MSCKYCNRCPIEECPDNCQEFALYQESDKLLMAQIENDERVRDTQEMIQGLNGLIDEAVIETRGKQHKDLGRFGYS